MSTKTPGPVSYTFKGHDGSRTYEPVDIVPDTLVTHVVGHQAFHDPDKLVPKYYRAAPELPDIQNKILDDFEEHQSLLKGSYESNPLTKKGVYKGLPRDTVRKLDRVMRPEFHRESDRKASRRKVLLRRIKRMQGTLSEALSEAKAKANKCPIPQNIRNLPATSPAPSSSQPSSLWDAPLRESYGSTPLYSYTQPPCTTAHASSDSSGTLKPFEESTASTSIWFNDTADVFPSLPL